MKSSPHFEYENNYWHKGYAVIGIDEVGRGCLAGPITVGAVCFPSTLSVADQKKILKLGIQDSKKLTPRKRVRLADLIKHSTIYCATASSDVETINKEGIECALRIAIAQVAQKYMLAFPESKLSLLVDGRTIPNIPYINDIERTHIIGGDGISVSIAAASIVAKVSRDQYMDELSGHKLYGWEKNKGYGTKQHCEAIAKYGLTPHHRLLFVRKVLRSAIK